MVLVSVALSLIALAGGMFLLAKTIKDNLGRFFRFIAYFIIISAFLNLACAAVHGIMKGYGMKRYHKMMRYEKFRDDDMGFHRMWHFGYHGDFGNCCPVDGCKMHGKRGAGKNECCKGMVNDTSALKNK